MEGIHTPITFNFEDNLERYHVPLFTNGKTNIQGD